MTAVRVLFLLGAALVIGACRSGTSTAPQRPGQTASESVPPEESVSWVFHPFEQAPATARYELKGGRSLVLDEAGTRWLVPPGTGPAKASAYGASEPLVHLGRDGGRYLFVGRGGSVFVAREPLGPYIGVRSPPTDMVTASAAQGTLLATSNDGKLYRSTNWGRTWQSRGLPGFVASSAMSARGRAVAVTLPEQWFTSADAGGSWQPADWDLAPLALTNSGDGRVVAHTLLGSKVYQGGRFVPFDAPAMSPAKQRDVPPFASAAALNYRQASLAETYFELRRAAHGFRARRGSLGRPLQELAVNGLQGCGNLVTAAWDQLVFVLCAPEDGRGASPVLRLYRSRDGGREFVRVPVAMRGQMPKLRMALSSSGTLAMTGLCLPGLSKPGCDPSGIQVLFPNQPRTQTLQLPGVEEPRALAFAGASRLWALGRRSKDGHALLFSSLLDAPQAQRKAVREQSSEPAAADEPGPPEEPGAPDEPAPSAELQQPPLRVEHMIDLHAGKALRSLGDQANLRLAPGSDGSVSALFPMSPSFHVVHVGPRGEILASGGAPAGLQSLHGVGRRLLGVDPHADRIWESVDGGLSWQGGAAPRPLCDDPDTECPAPVACSASGCVIGDELTRLGWGNQIPASPNLDLPGSQDASAVTGVSYLCQAAGQWQDLGPLQHVPDAGDAAMGPTAWSQVRQELDTGAVTAIHADFQREELEEIRLLDPVQNPSSYAQLVSNQMEGAAALRYRIPPRALGQGMISQVQVAWDNRIEDIVGRAVLPGQFAPLAGDYRSGSGELQEAAPELISVAGRGLYLRLHHPEELAQKTYFFRSNGVEEVPAAQFPLELLDDGRREMVRIAGMHSPLLLLHDGRAVLRAMPNSAGEYRNVPQLLGLFDADQRDVGQGTSIAYTGKRLGFVTLVVSLDGKRWSARLTRLGTKEAFEDPIDLPLFLDLPDPPPACSAEQRAGWTRLVAPAFPTRRHEITVEIDGERTELSSGRAVLFGQAEAGCLGALEAESPKRAPDSLQPYRLLMFPGQASITGWLFRASTKNQAPQTVATRRVTCELQ